MEQANCLKGNFAARSNGKLKNLTEKGKTTLFGDMLVAWQTGERRTEKEIRVPGSNRTYDLRNTGRML